MYPPSARKTQPLTASRFRASDSCSLGKKSKHPKLEANVISINNSFRAPAVFSAQN